MDAPTNAGPADAGRVDASPTDAGPAGAGRVDAGPTDAGPSAGPADVDALLADKLEELDREIASLTAPPEQAGDISFGKRVGDGTSIAVERLTQVATHDRFLQVREEVRRAQAKRVDGTYGRCDRCGRPIPEGRLEALPWATTHVDCDRPDGA